MKSYSYVFFIKFVISIEHSNRLGNYLEQIFIHQDSTENIKAIVVCNWYRYSGISNLWRNLFGSVGQKKHFDSCILLVLCRSLPVMLDIGSPFLIPWLLFPIYSVSLNVDIYAFSITWFSIFHHAWRACHLCFYRKGSLCIWQTCIILANHNLLLVMVRHDSDMKYIIVLR